MAAAARGGAGAAGAGPKGPKGPRRGGKKPQVGKKPAAEPKPSTEDLDSELAAYQHAGTDTLL